MSKAETLPTYERQNIPDQSTMRTSEYMRTIPPCVPCVHPAPESSPLQLTSEPRQTKCRHEQHVLRDVLTNPSALQELRYPRLGRPTIVTRAGTAAVASGGRVVWVTSGGKVPWAVESMQKAPGATVFECREEGACLACVALGRGVWS